jgi:hypothetical protein
MSSFAADEKQIDNSEYRIPVSIQSDSVSGNLDGTGGTYNRIFTGDVSDTCSATSTLSGNDNVFYQVFELHSPSGQLADIEVVLTGLGDSTLSLYCNFDPSLPQDMLSIYDDDGGAGLGSAITPADAFSLVPNQSYYAVVASFANGATGTFDLVLGGDLVFGPAAPPTPVPFMNNVSILLLSLVLIGFASFSFKRKFS